MSTHCREIEELVRIVELVEEPDDSTLAAISTKYEALAAIVLQMSSYAPIQHDRNVTEGLIQTPGRLKLALESLLSGEDVAVPATSVKQVIDELLMLTLNVSELVAPVNNV